MLVSLKHTLTLYFLYICNCIFIRDLKLKIQFIWVAIFFNFPTFFNPKKHSPHAFLYFLFPLYRYEFLMMILSRSAFIFLATIPSFLHSQKLPQSNIIPNPGFEEFSDQPSGWYYSGKDFSRVSLYWTSPNDSSPDLYTPKVTIPPSWKAVGFGAVKSFEGVSHAGITVYGCDKGKPHCREYVQVQLTEPLVPGQRYGFSCMLAHLQKSVFVRNIELLFTDHEIEEAGHDPILQTPTLVLDRWIPSDGKWYRWSGHFVANQSSSFMIIGNFNLDSESQGKMPFRGDLKFGYYYIDDVRLFKIPPILATPPSDSPLSGFVPKSGEVVSLSRIYFEHDRIDFMPRALIQLEQLFEFLNRYPRMKVEIIGHTDNVGKSDYNQALSERRSGAVLSWLVSKGISRDRLTSSGMGSTKPVSTNLNSPGRSQNRRVEVKIISL